MLTAFYILVLTYFGLLLALYLGQRRLLYVPDSARVAPAAVGLAGVVERSIATLDGERLIAWYGAAKPGQPTLLYFHGNAGGLHSRASRFAQFMAEGWGVYMVSYRSFSGSSGQPTETSNRADAMTAFAALLAEGVAAGRIVAYGESLGSHMAARVALTNPVAGLILEAPYTTIPEVAARRFPYFPVRLLSKDRYDTASIIDALKVPLLVMHGARDAVVPVDMGREIARLAPEPKRYVEYPEHGHSDLYAGRADAIAAVRRFIAEALPAR